MLLVNCFSLLCIQNVHLKCHGDIAVTGRRMKLELTMEQMSGKQRKLLNGEVGRCLISEETGYYCLIKASCSGLPNLRDLVRKGRASRTHSYPVWFPPILT